MSKSLPSTRVLLKTQYIPLLEKEKKMLTRANKFLAEVISREKDIRREMGNIYFNCRFGFPQFSCGGFFMESNRGSRNHTEKNISACMSLLAEKYPVGLTPALNLLQKSGLKKLEIIGLEGIKNKIDQIWKMDEPERCLYLPPGLLFKEMLELCEYKESVIKEIPKNQRSKHSLILIYISEINFNEIQTNPDLMKRYHNAINSNIFINIDGEKVFNNRESIYEACIRETFGKGLDPVSQQVTHHFLHEC